MLVWAILQKDFILYIGVKLKMQYAGKTSGFKNKLWVFGCKIAVKITLWTTEVVLLALSAAAIANIKTQSCNDMDFIANSLGYDVVRLSFYIL